MKGKTIVITGAGGVLGRAVARAAEACGAVLALIDIAPLEEGPGFRFGEVDLANFAAAQQVMAAIQARAGRLDVLLNIAGGFRWQMLENGNLETWDDLYRMNVKATVCASKAALPHLVEARHGAIVNVGAASALRASAGMGAYAASKSGVMRLTESLAEEFKGRVRVNAVLPSIIDTPANRKDMPDADFSKWVQPCDLAEVMLFLASPNARAVTGALVTVTAES